MHVIIVANGEMRTPDIELKEPVQIIAVNGGASACLSFGINPHVVIGDFDSLTKKEISTLESFGSEFIRFPESKDKTDLELALSYAVENGASDIKLYGLLGGRRDMSLANILLLASPEFKGVRFYIEDGNNKLYIVRSGVKLTIHGEPEDQVSAIPLSPQVTEITYKGLEWILNGETLIFGSTRGISNKLINSTASISVGSGILLVAVQNQQKSLSVHDAGVYDSLNGSVEVQAT